MSARHASVSSGILITGPLLAALLALSPGPARADAASDAYAAMGVRPQKVLSGSVLTARVVPGEAKQVVAVVTYFTGKRDEARAVNVRFEIFRRQGDALASVYARDFGEENGGYVAGGDLGLVDLDGDGVNEIIVEYDNLTDPLIKERRGEVLVREGDGFRPAWTGSTKYDATRAARKLPAERRDHFSREVDIAETLRTRGRTLVMKKKVIAVAGERLPEPRLLKETFPLRSD